MKKNWNRSSANLCFCFRAAWALSIAAVPFLGSAAFADDAPNSEYEQKMAKAYQARSHTDPAVWAMMTSQLNQKTYVTHKGETLRDVSELLFGDPSYWPKIWSLNKSITDPFALPAGTVISFKDGGTDAPPTLGLSVGKDKDLDHPAPDATPYAIGTSLNAEIPASSHQKAAAIAELPESLPAWSFAKPVYTKITMDLERPAHNSSEALKNLEYYASEKEAPAEGVVQGTEMNLGSAAEFQYIYVKFTHAPTQKNYMVIKDSGEAVVTGPERVPILTQVQGKVEVLEAVNSKENIYRAIVRKSLANVEVGAKLVPGELPTYTVSNGQNAAKVDAKIVGGGFDSDRHLFGIEGILFLDQGSSAGVAVGQVLPVYQYQRSHEESEIVQTNPRVIGKVKVVKTSEHFSTAVVLSSTSEIEIGDGTSPDLRNR